MTAGTLSAMTDDDMIRPGDALQLVLDAGQEHAQWAAAMGAGEVPVSVVDGHLRIRRADVNTWISDNQG